LLLLLKYQKNLLITGFAAVLSTEKMLFEVQK